MGGTWYGYDFFDGSGYFRDGGGYFEDGDGYGGFNAGLLWGYDFGLWAAQVEVLLTGDNGQYSRSKTESYIAGYNSGVPYYNSYTAHNSYDFSGTTIQIPFMAKLDLHWGRFMFQPQAGLYLNLALGDMEIEEHNRGGITYQEYSPPLFGAMFGGALGFRIGRGYLFTDLRYAINFGSTEVDDHHPWLKSAFMVSLGYQYYFRNRSVVSPDAQTVAQASAQPGESPPPEGQAPAPAEAPVPSAVSSEAPAAPQEGVPEKGFFAGAKFGGSLYVYEFKDYYSNTSWYQEGSAGGGFSAGLQWGYDFGLLAAQVEILLTGDRGNYSWDTTSYKSYWNGSSWTSYSSNDYNHDYFNGTTIQIPFMAKLDLHWKRLMFQPQAGLYLNLPLGDMAYEGSTGSDEKDYSPPPFGAMFGTVLGVRIGRGYLFFDYSYAVNFGYTKLEGREFAERSAHIWNLGYQYYFRSKK
jgi:hypothetical protein